MARDYTYFVSGKLYARLAGSNAAFEWPGLVDSVSIQVQEQVISLPDRTQSGGGVYKEIRRIESMNLTINQREFHPTQLARALFGDSNLVQGSTKNEEEHVAYPGKFVPLDHPGHYTNVAVTQDDTGKTPITAEDNYDIVPGGLLFKEDAADVDTLGTAILVTYTYPGYHRIEALTQSAPELELFFAGVNEAADDKQFNVRIHKVRLGSVQDLQLLSGDDFGALQVTGQVLKDTTKTGQGESQYFYADLVE
jgi:hypothetical protein